MSNPISPYHVIVMSSIARHLENQMNSNNCLALEMEAKSCFDAKVRGDVTLEMYLRRIVESTQMETSTLKYALRLLEVYCEKTSLILLRKNCHKLLLVCCFISLKINEDYIYSDKDFASFGGIKIKTLMELEKEFLESLDYKVAFL